MKLIKMASHKNQLLWYIAVSLMLFIENTLQDCESEDELYLIRHRGTGLVFDSGDPEVIRLQYFTNKPAQLWKFVRGRDAGLFYIYNNAAGKVLDYYFNATGNYYPLVLKLRSESLSQQWFINGDGTIMSADKLNFYMDVYKDHKETGTPVDIWDGPIDNTKFFILQKIN